MPQLLFVTSWNVGVNVPVLHPSEAVGLLNTGLAGQSIVELLPTPVMTGGVPSTTETVLLQEVTKVPLVVLIVKVTV